MKRTVAVGIFLLQPTSNRNEPIHMRWVLCALFIYGVVAAMISTAEESNAPALQALQRADKLFKDQQWAEARSAYDAARSLEREWASPSVRQAVERAVGCSVKLEQFDDALSRAEQFVAKTKGKFEEAVGERFLGGLYLGFPHQGTKRGTTFLRNQWVQGVHVVSWRKDCREAIRHYERARELLQAQETKWGKKKAVPERIGVDFDLVTALSADGQYGYQYAGLGRPLWWWWGQDLEAEEDSQAVAEADYEEWRWWSWHDLEQEPPTGIPLASNGQPEFIQSPATYASNQGAGQKIRFLLDEVERLDISANKDDAARALFRRAMIARTLYSPDSVTRNGVSSVRYDRFGNAMPAQDGDVTEKKIWELGEDEAITFVGGKVRLVVLPPSESPIALLRELQRKYPRSQVCPEAQYSLGLYFQTRQQFPEAVREYQVVLAKHPGHKRVVDAREQLRRIAQPDVILDVSGIHLPETKPKLSFTYRNSDTIEFKALKFDLVKYLQEEMETTPAKDSWEYRNFQHFFFQTDRWKRYLGPEIRRWTEKVRPEPGNRVAEGVTAAPLGEAGAYLVEASVPGKADPSRVLVLVTDIAIVQKNVPGKGMIYLCDARTGQPLPEKSLRIYEHWSIYNQKNRKSDLFWDFSTVTTDTNGVAFYQSKHSNPRPEVDAIMIGEQGRMAFSFFQNWDESSNGQGDWRENGPRYYVITDRPVYRPGDTVRFKVWLRELRDRQYGQIAREQVANVDPRTGLPLGQTVVGIDPYTGLPITEPAANIDPATGVPVSQPAATIDPNTGLPSVTNSTQLYSARIEIHDTKDIVVKTLPLQADEFGCVTGEYTLGSDAGLGIWHLMINNYHPDTHYNAGGLFRVEEYKKPEFEVRVKPAKSQARLGEKVAAKIEARYYFGAPVANGSVSYKIFREEYHHVYWGPGEYDWLYGKGYGRSCYAYPWLAWWGTWGGFLCRESWWPWPYGVQQGWIFPWGYYGSDEESWTRRYESGTRKALRELVSKGAGKLALDGTFTVDIDTSRAKSEQADRDHRFTIEAEVRDESRRTIEGQVAFWQRARISMLSSKLIMAGTNPGTRRLLKCARSRQTINL